MPSDLDRTREALAGALQMDDGPERREALARALEARLAAGPPDEAVSNALSQLGRDEELHAALLEEVRHYATEPSTMLLGAWGAHLVRVFERLGERRYKAFRRFLVEAYAREGEGAKAVRNALVAASLSGDQATLRGHFLGTASDVLMDWRASQAGFDPST